MSSAQNGHFFIPLRSLLCSSAAVSGFIREGNRERHDKEEGSKKPPENKAVTFALGDDSRDNANNGSKYQEFHEWLLL